MRFRRLLGCTSLLACAAALVLAACASSPKTGGQQKRTILLTEYDDARAGEEASGAVAAQMGLFEDPELGFCICAHVYLGSASAPPHDHGPTWAIYGQATGQTVMTEFKALQAPDGDTPGKVEPVKTYELNPGMAVAYPTGRLHAPKREGDTRLIRIEGRNLDHVSRDAFELA